MPVHRKGKKMATKKKPKAMMKGNEFKKKAKMARKGMKKGY